MIYDIITCDANSLSWAKIWEYSKSYCHVIDEVIITEIIVFDIIYVDWILDSAAKFNLFFNFTTTQYGRQMRSLAILETKSETESWLP